MKVGDLVRTRQPQSGEVTWWWCDRAGVIIRHARVHNDNIRWHVLIGNRTVNLKEKSLEQLSACNKTAAVV